MQSFNLVLRISELKGKNISVILAQRLLFTEEISSQRGYVSCPTQRTGFVNYPVGMAPCTCTPTTDVFPVPPTANRNALKSSQCEVHRSKYLT